MRLIIAGSRDYHDRTVVYETIKLALESWFKPFLSAHPEVVIEEVVSGRCRGVDLIGEDWAKLNRIPVKTFPLSGKEWEAQGRAAGPIRNGYMVDYAREGDGKHTDGKGGALIAIWRRRSRGTHDVIKKARAGGLLVYIREVP